MTRNLYEELTARFGKESVFMDVDTIPLGVNFHEHLLEASISLTAKLIENAPSSIRCSSWFGSGCRRTTKLPKELSLALAFYSTTFVVVLARLSTIFPTPGGGW